MFTYREKIFIILSIIIAISFYISFFAFQLDLKSYKIAYKDCLKTIDNYNKGFTDVYGRYYINTTNLSLIGG